MSPNPTASPFWPADNPSVIAHLNILQGIINRLAANSVSCKTWCLTLVGAMVSLAGATHVPAIAGFTLVPVLIFGFMDTMYLAEEKSYRDLYNSMVSSIRDRSYKLDRVFEASADRGFGSVTWAIASWSIWPVYVGLIAAYVLAQSQGWLVLLANPRP
jgi:hypothetical protein